MTDATSTPSAGWRMKFAAFSLAVSIFSVIWFMVAALGTRFGLWPYQVGLLQMTIGIGAKLAMLALGLGLVAQVMALIKYPRVQPMILALVATLIAAMGMFRLVGFGSLAGSLPPIHDIQTDWGDPVAFSDQLMALRAEDGATNPVLPAPTVPDYAESRWPGTAGRLVSDLQAEAEPASAEDEDALYPRIDPLYFDQAPDEVAALAQRLMDRRGWTPVAGPETLLDGSLRLEATAQSGWFGFRDDIALRLRSLDGVTRVDVRSISRVGLSDLGANAKRVNGLLMEMQDRGDGRWAP